MLVTQMKDTKGITEQLKAKNPIEWVRIMNLSDREPKRL
ncbi:TnpV protein [Ruminococcus sp.]